MVDQSKYQNQYQEQRDHKIKSPGEYSLTHLIPMVATSVLVAIQSCVHHIA